MFSITETQDKKWNKNHDSIDNLHETCCIRIHSAGLTKTKKSCHYYPIS